MIVVDASVLVNAVGDDGPDGHRARTALAREGGLSAPDLVDVETAAVLRKHWLTGEITEGRFGDALSDLMRLPVHRYPTLPFLGRAAELKANVTMYDAVYVALAEALDCPLVTADARLVTAPGIRCAVEIVSHR